MEYLSHIRRKLSQFNRESYILKTLVLLLAAGFGIFSIYLIFDSIFILSSLLRFIFLGIIIVVPLYIFARFLFIKASLYDVALEVEREYPEFKERLLTAVESPSIRETPGYSKELTIEIVKQSCQLLKRVELGRLLKKKIKPLLTHLFTALIVPILFVALLPHKTLLITKRLFLPYKSFLSLEVSPGNKRVLYDEAVEIRVVPKGIIPRKIWLYVADLTESYGQVLPLYKENGFKYVINPTHDISYYASVSDVKSEHYKLEVAVKPYLKELKVTYYYPTYTSMPPFTQNYGFIEAMEGTRVNIKGETNTPLDKANLCFAKAGTLVADIQENRFDANFTITQNDTYWVDLLAINGYKNDNPNLFTITVYKDEPPKVEVIVPGRDIPIPEDAIIPLGLHVQDDYGVSKVELIFNKNERITLITFKRKPVDTLISYEWDISNILLLPGDTLSYFALVYDNDTYRGPKIGKSKVYKIYFPTVEEMYRTVEKASEEVEEHLEDILSHIKKVEERLEKIYSESQRERRALSWEEREALKQELEKAKSVREQLSELEKSIESITQKLENTMFVDRDLVQKLEEIRRLLSEALTPELKEILREIEQNLVKNPELAKEALRKFQLSEEELRKRIERTLNILRRYMEEEKLRQLAKEAERIKSIQEDINKLTKEAQASELNKLSKREETLKEELDKLGEEMAKLSIPEIEDSLASELSRIAEISNKMEQASSQLSKGQRPCQLQQSILSELQKLANKLNSLCSCLACQRKSEIANKIRNLEKSLNMLSQEQEKLLEGKKSFTDMASVEERISEGTKNVKKGIEDLTQITPFISPQAKQYVEDALSNMDEAKSKFINKRISQGKKEGAKAMELLNLATLELMRSEDALRAASSSTGFEQLMQQLAEIAKQQMGLNKLSQSLLPFNVMNKEMAQQLADLIGKQQALAEALKRVAEGLKGRALGDLGGTAREMEQLAEEMQRGRITEEIIKRQNKILRHLLDAQKSIYTKKFSKRRISEPGKDFVDLPSPKELELMTKRGISQKDILKALREKYPKEYEKLIRAYFKALSTE